MCTGSWYGRALAGRAPAGLAVAERRPGLAGHRRHPAPDALPGRTVGE